MKNLNKILAVSFVAMLAVPAAHAKIVAETMLSETAGHYSSTHTVQDEIGTLGDLNTSAKGNLVAAINEVKTGASAGATALQKSDITTGSANGTIAVDGDDVAVKGLGAMAYKAAVASGDITDGTIVNADVSSSAAITTNKMGAITGYEKATTNANLATTDTLNTALGKLEKKADDAAAAAAAAASTASSHTHASQDVTAMTGYTKASTAAAIAATDSLNTAIGKLEKTVDGKVTANSAITASGTTNKIVQYDSKGLVVAGTTAGSLATKNAVASADITDGTIVNADISSSAAIDQSKISGLSTSLSGKVDVAQGSGNADKVLITNATTGDVETTTFVHADGYNAQLTGKDTKIPSVELVEDIAATAAGDMVDEEQGAANKNRVMSTTSTGKVTPSTLTGSNGVSASVADTGAVTVSGTDATKNAKGVMQVGDDLTVSSGTVSVDKATTVANGNTKPVTSGAVYTAINNAKAATLSGDELTGTGTTGRLITGAQYGAKQNVQIGAAKVSGADSTDKGKAVVVDANGKIAMSDDKLGTLAYKSTVVSADITDGTITTSDIKDGTITTSDISSSAGITKGQLASAVQTSLGKADTALQASDVTSTYSATGTAPVNGTAVASAISNLNSGGTYEVTANKVTSVTSSSTDTQYPSAKAVNAEFVERNLPDGASVVALTPSTAGKYVLTAEVITSGSNAGTHYYWEDIGR